MTNEQRAALDLAILNLKTHGDDQLLTAIKPLIDFYESGRAAGASEGQATRIAWDGFVVQGDKDSVREVFRLVNLNGRQAQLEAEIAALRERIAGMEKDAERLAWFSRHVTVEMLNNYTRHVLSRGGDGDLSDIRTFLDVAIAKEKQP